MSTTVATEVLIIGSGIMGSAVARLIRESHPHAQIIMVDGGSPIGDTPGLHIHDIDDPELWDRYNERVASGIQGMYTGAEVNREIAVNLAELEPGMFHTLALGERTEAMPSSALSWNVGGMGVHWTAATPWPAGAEVFDRGDPDAWAADLDTARRLLQVVPSAFEPTAPGRAVLDVLRRRYADAPVGREPQPMPMAVAPTPSGKMSRTGPSVIFPPLGDGADESFTLVSGTLAVALLVDDSTVRGARVRSVASGDEYEIHARITYVCADTLRTPQLLFASGIRPPALGRYLNEHAFVSGRVLLDLDEFGLERDALPIARDGEFCTDSLWVPQNGPTQPFHGQIMNVTYVDDAQHPLAHSVGLSFYTPVESRPDNRVTFSDTEVDVAGMPRLTIEFTYSETDLHFIDRALDELQQLAEQFGQFDPDTERTLLTPGSSLHLTGTVRCGPEDDGTSVCDPDGRVWGFDNLYVAGNGVVPTPVVANATLTGMITAVRAARAGSRMLLTVAS